MKPTEQEIRTAFATRAKLWPGDDPRRQLHEAIATWADVLTSPTRILDASDRDLAEELGLGDEAYNLWRDLRASEAVTLRELSRKAVDRAASAAEKVIVDELVKAAIAFADEHPDAPRAKPRARPKVAA